MLIPVVARDAKSYASNILISGGGLVFGDVIKNKLSKNIILTREKDEKDYNNIIGTEDNLVNKNEK